MSRNLPFNIVLPFFFLALLFVLLFLVVPDDFPIPRGIIFWFILVALLFVVAAYAKIVRARAAARIKFAVSSVTLD